MNIKVIVNRWRSFSGFVRWAQIKVVPVPTCFGGQKGLFGMLVNDDVGCRRAEQEDAVPALPQRNTQP